MRSFGLVALSLLVAACGDDDQPAANGQGGQGVGGAGTGGQGADGQGANGGVGAGGGGASGGAGGAACGDGVGEADLEGGEWDARFTIAGVSSPYGIAPMVHDFARDLDGSLLAAGGFDSHEGAPVPPLLRWTGAAWEPARTVWELPPPGAGFSAVAVSPSGTLALATNDNFGEKTGEIWIDDGAGLVSIGAFDGRVRRLAFFDGMLWVGGLFSIDGGAGTPIEGLAVWDGTEWSAPPGGSAVGPVFELVVDGDALFVGGAFDQVGGVMAASVASYDGASWTPYDFDGALSIYALARTAGGELYAGGAFGDFSAASGVARWDGAAWQIVGGGVGQYQTRGVVTDLVFHDGVLDVTGCFNSAGGLDGTPGAVDSQSVARWDGASWQSLDDGTQGAVSPWFAPLVCGDEGLTAVWDVPHQALASDGQRVVAGGAFAGIGGVQSQSLIAHDGASWVAQGETGLGIGGSIDVIAAGGPDCSVYGTGTFTHVAGEPKVGRVVHYDGNAWNNLSDSLPHDAWCPAIDVSSDGEVAVGCMVFPPIGDALGVVLRRDGDAMVAMDTAGLGPVMSVAWSPSGALWVGGAGLTGYLARIDGDTVEIVEEGFDGPVQQIDVAADDDVLVAGAFTQIATLPAARIARWDGASWSALGDGLPASATALARDSRTVYASTYDEGSGAFLLGAFDGTSWQELATPQAGLTPQSFFNFNAIEVVDGAVIAAGSTELDDGSGRGVVVYRDGSFTALGGGVSAIGLGGLAVTDDAVWVAGSITAAGPEDDATSSVGVARLALGRP